MTQIGMIRIGFGAGVSAPGLVGLALNVFLTIFVVFTGFAMVNAFRIKTTSSWDKVIITFAFIIFFSANVGCYHVFCHSKPIEVPQYEVIITKDTDIKEITDNYTVDKIEDGKIIFH